MIIVGFSLLFPIIGNILYREKKTDRLLGTGKGITLLLAKWITPVTFLAAAEATYVYGITGLAGFCVFGAFGFCFIALLCSVPRFRNHSAFLNSGWIFFLQWAVTLETLFIVFTAGKLLVQDLFLLSKDESTIVFMFVLWILLFIRKHMEFQFVPVLQVGLIMIGVMIVPALVFFKVSIPTVYSGVHFLATEMLQWNSSTGWLYLTAMMVVSTGKILLDPITWLICTQIRKEQQIPAFLISGLMWLFVPMSFGSLAFAAKAQAIWPNNPSNTAPLVIQTLGGGFGFLLFAITLWTSLLSSSFMHLRGLHSRSGGLHFPLFLLVPLIALGSHVFDWTVLQVLFSFGIVWGVSVPPFLYRIWFGKIPRAILIADALAGYGAVGITLAYKGLLAGIIVGFLSSSAIMLFQTAVRWAKLYMLQEEDPYGKSS